jgi:hypothetical protein
LLDLLTFEGKIIRICLETSGTKDPVKRHIPEELILYCIIIVYGKKVKVSLRSRGDRGGWNVVLSSLL